MKQKTPFSFRSPPRLFPLLLLPLMSLGSQFSPKAFAQSAQARPLELSIQSSYQLMTQPLSTELVTEIDPLQIDPHRQRWILSRKVNLAGLQALAQKNGRFGVSAQGLLCSLQGYVRAPGLWYQPWEQFSCQPQADAWFATDEGSKRAAAEASRVWQELLDQKKDQLLFLFNRLSEKTEASALDQAERVFRTWLSDVEREWRNAVQTSVRNEEWRFYLSEAKAAGHCPKKTKTPASAQSPRWELLLEPPSQDPPAITQLLARAPARLWDGFYTVRVSMRISGKTLNGRFLLDPKAQFSVISPEWLESQGIYPLWVLVSGAPAQRITWSGPWPGQGALAPEARIESASVSGLALPIHRFLLKETEFFAPPESLGHCCDGVLGIDFLRRYPIEFQSSSPAEVRIWPIHHYRAPQAYTWQEISETELQGLSFTGDFILDLPHGRLWTPQESSKKFKPVSSGLEVEFILEDGERILKVRRITPRSKAAALLRENLAVGSRITQINSKPVEELDLWEVRRILSGSQGQSVILQWKTKKGVKLGKLDLG
ncbi:MAG: hypothetical protein ACO3A2_09385 [Bdellovibrionia bacterium]